jgi:hypothetical protein
MKIKQFITVLGLYVIISLIIIAGAFAVQSTGVML